MGCNIPRPRKRSKNLNVDAIYGALTANEIRKRYGLDPVREVKPIYIGGERCGEVVREKTQERSPYNCPNCCAPITKEYCEYCGTRFGYTVVKVDGFKKNEEIERLKKAINGEKTLLFADNSIVAEFHRFSSTAHDLYDTPGTTTQYR